jgi:hypothetical protein
VWWIGQEAAGYFPMANVSLLNGKPVASVDDGTTWACTLSFVHAVSN